jgi:hypothetical protein
MRNCNLKIFSDMQDLAIITRHLRAKASSHLLVAAVHYFSVFEVLKEGPLTIPALQNKMGLRERPAMVLFPALLAMKLLQVNQVGQLELTEAGGYLTLSNPLHLVG